MRFAVHRPGIPEASPRSHGVPRRDVDGRVHVRVAGEAAGSAHEARLTLTRVPVHLPARRAPLARERGSDLLHPARGLVLQPPRQQPPPRTPGSPGSARLSAGRSGRDRPATFTGPGHVLDLQVLNPDHVEPPRDAGAALLRPVLAPVALPGPQPGDHVLHPRRGGSIPASRGRAYAAAAAAWSAPARPGRGSAAARRWTGPRRPPPPGQCPPPGRYRARESARGSPRRRHATGPPGPSSPGRTSRPAAPRGTSGTAPSRPSAPRPGRPSGTPDAPPTACPARRSGIPHPARPCARTAARPGSLGRGYVICQGVRAVSCLIACRCARGPVSHGSELPLVRSGSAG